VLDLNGSYILFLRTNSLNDLKLREFIPVVEFKAKKLRTCTRLYGRVSERCQLLEANQSSRSTTSFLTMMLRAAASLSFQWRSCPIRHMTTTNPTMKHMAFETLKRQARCQGGWQNRELRTCSSSLRTSIARNA
jgi:hypothetical protein